MRLSADGAGYFLVGPEPTVLAVGVVGSCLDVFSLVYHRFFLLSFCSSSLHID